VTRTVALTFACIMFAPLAGGIIRGLDRRLTARFQSRVGPPLLQPFYDAVKLLTKEKTFVNVWQAFCAFVFLVAAGVSVVLFFLQADLLLIIFVHGVSSVFLVVGALSAASPYSQVGAHRELLQILTYKPLLIFAAIGIYLETGSFKIVTVYGLDQPLLFKLPLLFVLLVCALTIEFRKSPFDFAGSHHAHQEIVRGVLTEYSGRYLAAIEVGHWYEVVLLLGICSLFWATNPAAMILLAAAVYFVQILVDNITARLTWRWMLRYVWGAGLTMALLNLIWLYVE